VKGPTWNVAAKLEGLRESGRNWKKGPTPIVGCLAECVARWLDLPGYKQRECWISWGYIWGDESHGRMDGEAIAAYVIANGIPPHLAAQRGGQPPQDVLREMVAMPRYDPDPYPGSWHLAKKSQY
jgi:hypothetical protein